MKNKQLQSPFRSGVSGLARHCLALGYTARIIVGVLALGVCGVAPAVADDTGAGSGSPDPRDSDRIDYGRPTTSKSIGETAKQVWASDKLTGDWDGARTDLHDYGIDIDLRLSQYVQSVASGGVDENTEYGATMDYRVNVDLNKLVGSWKGLSVNMHARTRWGKDVNADAGSFVLENAGLLMPSPGDYHDSDVTGLTATQTFPLFGRPAAVTLGMLDVVDTVTGFFPNIAAGQEGFWNIHSQVSALPWFGAVRGLSLWGAIGVSINPEFEMAQTGVLATGTQNESTSWGSLPDAFDEGVFLAAFHRFFRILEVNCRRIEAEQDKRSAPAEFPIDRNEIRFGHWTSVE